MIHRSFVCCLLVLLAWPSLLAARVCEICPTAAEDSLVQLINDFRATNQLSPLTVDRRLFIAARRHAADLTRNDFLSFTGTDGSTPATRRADAGYLAAGEANVIVNSTGAQATFDQLLNSPAATANFLNPDLHHIGVGRQADNDGPALNAWSLDYGYSLGLPDGAMTCFSAYCPPDLADSLLTLINQIRLDSGLTALEFDDRLAGTAHQQACDMSTYSYFTDSSLLGASSDGRMLLVRYQVPGGTLLANEPGDPGLVLTRWLADTEAAQLLLNPPARHVGIGFAESGHGPVPHAWVADMGLADEMARPLDCACCVGSRGNVDYDPLDNVTLTDLTTLVNSLFVTFEPLPCIEEANVSGDPENVISLSDLTVLVNHLFVTFEPLPGCLSAYLH